MKKFLCLSAAIAGIMFASAAMPGTAQAGFSLTISDGHHHDYRGKHWHRHHRHHRKHHHKHHWKRHHWHKHHGHHYRRNWHAPSSYYQRDVIYIAPQEQVFHPGGRRGAKAYARPPANDRYCREYTTTVWVGNRQEQAYGTACQQPDGSWERY